MRALDRDTDTDEALEEARRAYARKLWRQAHSAYTAVRDNALMADDIERYAIAAHLVGNDAESGELLARGHRESLARDDVLRAVRFAFWIGHSLIFTGELAQAGGWWRRARSLLTEHAVDCVEWGMVLFADAVQQLIAGDVSTALETLAQVEVIGRRFADRDVLNGALFLRGRAFIQQGQCAEGMAALDEVMVAATSGELHPLRVGHAYCGVLQACWEVFDVRRAREWTAALTRWCEDQPDLVPYRGPCLVHRVELLRLRGDWQDALEEARRACDWLTQSTTPETPADAFYQLGELHRLRGDLAAADQAYRQASRLGRQVEPGVALLWLARGQADAAAAALRRVLDEPGPTPAARSELLDAYIEILLAMHEIATAQAASTELEQIAATLDALPLRARADRAIGSVLLAQGEARAALAPLRRSWTVWQQLEAPYEAARVRTLIGRAFRALADDESAALEFDAARWVFERLGAAYDLQRLSADSPPRAHDPASGLTAREVQVLGLIAAGATNRAIATALVISEHTVARHVQNMLQKLGCSSRASLAAFAVETGLARRSSG